MNKSFDIVIVGGGVIGLSLARALQAKTERGAIAVLDAGAAIPAATGAAAGMLAPSFEHGEGKGALGEAVYRLGADGLARWAEFAAMLEEESGVFIDYRPDGMLGVAFDEKEQRALIAQADATRALGGAAEIISGDDARKMEPGLSEEIVAALHAPNDAQVDPRRAITALKASLDRSGTAILPARVVRIEDAGASHEVVLGDGGRIGAQAVVIAFGAVSGLVGPDLVFPVKGEALAVAARDGGLRRVVRAPGAYLCPKAENRLVIGATEMRGRDDLDVDSGAIDGLKARAIRAAPGLQGAAELERWAGLRPGTPDGAPILGRDEKGRYLALGHYRNGVLHAPAAAAAMAALILGRAPALDLAPFSPDRFAGGDHG